VYLSIRYFELAENDIVTSVGSRGHSYYCAMAEAFNSLYKWGLIYPQRPWRGLDDDVELALSVSIGSIDRVPVNWSGGSFHGDPGDPVRGLRLFRNPSMPTRNDVAPSNLQRTK
jgi:hypothetical protein